jgi:hypothetical protein
MKSDIKYKTPYTDSISHYCPFENQDPDRGGYIDADEGRELEILLRRALHEFHLLDKSDIIVDMDLVNEIKEVIDI